MSMESPSGQLAEGEASGEDGESVTSALLEETSEAEALRPSTTRGSNSNRRLLLLVGPGLLLCRFVVSFDIAFLDTNYQRRIASGLHELTNAIFIVLGGFVTNSACQPLHSQVAQIYGRRPAVLIACTFLTIAFLFCSLSSTLWQLALSRVVAGMGTSGILLLVIVIINDLVKLEELPLWKSVVVAIDTCGLMLGGPVSSVFIDKFGWQWTFGLEFCVMFVATIAVLATLRLPRLPAATMSSSRIDFLGAIILLIAVAMPLSAINIGGNLVSWAHPAVIALLCLTPLGFGLFAYVESRKVTNPIIPMRFVRTGSVLAVMACVIPINLAFNQLDYNLLLYAEARSMETTSASPFNDWVLTFIYSGRPFGIALSGLILKRYSRFKPMLQINIIVAILMYLLIATACIKPERPQYVPFLFLVGVNVGISEGCLNVALLSLVGRKDQPPLYALFDLVEALAGDTGIAASASAVRTLVKANLRSTLGDSPKSQEIIRESLKSLEYIRALPQASRRLVLRGYIGSIETVFGVSCVLQTLSLIATFFMRELPKYGQGENTTADEYSHED